MHNLLHHISEGEIDLLLQILPSPLLVNSLSGLTPFFIYSSCCDQGTSPNQRNVRSVKIGRASQLTVAVNPRFTLFLYALPFFLFHHNLPSSQPFFPQGGPKRQ